MEYWETWCEEVDPGSLGAVGEWLFSIILGDDRIILKISSHDAFWDGDDLANQGKRWNNPSEMVSSILRRPKYTFERPRFW